MYFVGYSLQSDYIRKVFKVFFEFSCKMENFSVNEQIVNLGLEKVISNHNNFSVLDVGCGKKMDLVKYLIKNGFCAEGLDSAPKKIMNI